MDEEVIIALVAIGSTTLVALTWIVTGTARTISKRRQYEESRREIAAYVAEGSITPEDARHMLEARDARA